MSEITQALMGATITNISATSAQLEYIYSSKVGLKDAFSEALC